MNRWIFCVAVVLTALVGCTPPEATGPDLQAEDTPVESTAPVSAAGAGQQALPIAKVGDEVITRQELELAYKYLPPAVAPEVQRQGPTFLMDKMIEFELVYQEAIARGLDKEPDVADQFRKATRQFFYQVLMSREAPKDFEVTEDEIRAHYEANKHTYNFDARAKATQIMVAEESVAKVVAEKARTGADFAELVQEYSIDPTKATNGGDLGWFGQGRMIREFDEAVFSAKPGDILGPIKTAIGYHVIRVDDMKSAGQPDFDEVHDRIENELKQQKAEAWQEAFLKDLESRHPVQRFPENLPQL